MLNKLSNWRTVLRMITMTKLKMRKTTILRKKLQQMTLMRDSQNNQMMHRHNLMKPILPILMLMPMPRTALKNLQLKVPTANQNKLTSGNKF